MKKQIFLGLLLVGLTGLNAIPMIHKTSTLSNKNHTKSWKATSGLIASKITPKVNSLQQAQTKFINKIMPAVYEFAADYIQVMHPTKTHKITPKTTKKKTVTAPSSLLKNKSNLNQAQTAFDKAQTAFLNAIRKFNKSRAAFMQTNLAKEFKKALNKFHQQKSNPSKFRELPITKAFLKELNNLKNKSNLNQAQTAFNKAQTALFNARKKLYNMYDDSEEMDVNRYRSYRNNGYVQTLSHPTN